jgi:hypothetical protein
MLPGAARINVRKIARYAGRDCAPLHYTDRKKDSYAELEVRMHLPTAWVIRA